MEREQEEQLEKARENAWSFSGLIPPNDAQLIGSVVHKDDIYNYYRDTDGNYYFDTERMRAFEKEMQEVQKKRKLERHKKSRHVR